MASPNLCRHDRARPNVTIDPHNGNPAEVRCPTCRRRIIGHSEEKAISEWNYYNPARRWPYILAALVLVGLLAAAIKGGVFNG